MNIKVMINYLIIRFKIFIFDTKHKHSMSDFDKIISNIELFIFENRMYKFDKMIIIKQILLDLKVERNDFEHQEILRTYIEMN